MEDLQGFLLDMSLPTFFSKASVNGAHRYFGRDVGALLRVRRFPRSETSMHSCLAGGLKFFLQGLAVLSQSLPAQMAILFMETARVIGSESKR